MTEAHQGEVTADSYTASGSSNEDETWSLAYYLDTWYHLLAPSSQAVADALWGDLSTVIFSEKALVKRCDEGTPVLTEMTPTSYSQADGFRSGLLTQGWLLCQLTSSIGGGLAWSVWHIQDNCDLVVRSDPPSQECWSAMAQSRSTATSLPWVKRFSCLSLPSSYQLLQRLLEKPYLTARSEGSHPRPGVARAPQTPGHQLLGINWRNLLVLLRNLSATVAAEGPGSSSSSPPNTASRVAGITGAHHHTCLILKMSVDMQCRYVAPAGLKLLAPSDPPTLASQSAAITGTNEVLNGLSKLEEDGPVLCVISLDIYGEN
ncbi:hypothetical protein AAY473_002202 [Plecturocebus cupreus]